MDSYFNLKYHGKICCISCCLYIIDIDLVYMIPVDYIHTD